ncbi:YdcF family protein [Limibacillus halophilus]
MGEKPIFKERRRWPRRLVLLLLLLALLWVAGLFRFVSAMPDSVATPESQTDAIVVLTGGSDRLQEGIRLLAEGRAAKLLVSGVYRGVDVRALLRLSQDAPDELTCCIAIGYEADNTLGNARETAAWMAEEGFSSLRLVTAAYHMPRSLLLFREAMPEAEILPHPVFPEGFHQQNWYFWPGSSALVISEYSKYIVAQLQVWGRRLLG